MFRIPPPKKPEMTNIRSIHDYDAYEDKLAAYEKEVLAYKKAVELKPKLLWWAFISACVVVAVMYMVGAALCC